MTLNFQSSTWTDEVIRTRFPCPGLLDFLINLFLKKKSAIWAKYEQWHYRFKFLDRSKLHWPFHGFWNFNGILFHGFWKIRFLKWRHVNNSNSWFLAMLNGFSEGLPLFKIIFVLKIKSISTKINISYVILKSEN